MVLAGSTGPFGADDGYGLGLTPIDDFLVQYFTSPEQAATVRASSFSAGLELVREGLLEMRQLGAFEPIFVKAPDKPSDPSVEN